MKKRMLSMAVAAMMLLGSFANIAYAAPVDVYEGNIPLQTAERILDVLNADADVNSGLIDQSERAAQLDAIKEANTALASVDMNDSTWIDNNLSQCIDLLNTRIQASDYRLRYFVALKRAESEQDIADAMALPNTSGDNLRLSFGKLSNYADNMSLLFGDKDVDKNAYNLNDAKKYIAEPLIAIMKILFSEKGSAVSGMRDTYTNQFLSNDRAKKTLSVIFGADLTEEIVSDSGSNSHGIVRTVKAYLSGNSSAIAQVKTDLATVMDKENVPVNAAFTLLGKVVSAAYAGNPLQADVEMLMGNGTIKGLFQLLVEAADQSTGKSASNTWINLFLSEFVQLTLPGVAADTVSTSVSNPSKVTIQNGTSGNFDLVNLGSYVDFQGIDPSLPTTYFYVVCDNPNVSYNNSTGKFTVTTDSTKGQYYDAYLTLYRKDVTGSVDTFIESYPVTIQNYTPSSGGGGSTRYSVKYETNGGETISADYYVKGAKVQLTKVPVREGYIFNGWYSDAALTQRVDSVEMNGNITVYAAWTKDGSSVVSKVDIPELLEGEDHYAYVMGYPEGDIRPMGNITRAETVTMIFRLLKESVRTDNMTDENIFSDVNEDDWFNTAVSTLAGLGIVEGRTETEFMPDAYITRAEFATMFARLAEHEYVAENKYGDVDSHWAEENINEASAYGWIAGYEDDTFRPDKAINRAEAMTLVNRVLKRVPQSKDDLLEGMTIWTDNADTSAWYYLAVQEATNSHEYERKNESYETWTKLTENRDWTTYEK